MKGRSLILLPIAFFRMQNWGQLLAQGLILYIYCAYIFHTILLRAKQSVLSKTRIFLP